ncbi:MAG: hypothetical protein LBL82_08705 [Oscillospiraceae bacterium]|jgi:hypothetical protein|nr:hypothetical protein [Oscillospiraceae bacterium]
MTAKLKDNLKNTAKEILSRRVLLNLLLFAVGLAGVMSVEVFWDYPPFGRVCYLALAVCCSCFLWRNRTAVFACRRDTVISAVLVLILFLFNLNGKTIQESGFLFQRINPSLIYIDLPLLMLATFALVRTLFAVTKNPPASLLTGETEREEGKSGFGSGFRSVLIYSAAPFIVNVVYWISFFPSKVSPDTVAQWAQIHGDIPLTSVHALGHTMFLKALLSIVDSYAIVIFVQILLLSLTVGFICAYLRKKGVSGVVLMIISFAITFNQTLNYTILYPWKDLPYTICVMLLTFVFMRIVLDKGEVSLFWRVVGGLSTAGVYLCRHNGVLIFAFSVLLFLYLSFNFSKRRYLPVVAIAFALLLGVNAVATYGFGALSRSDGTAYAIFADGVSAVVVNDGDITADQMERIEEIFDVDFLKTHYSWSNGNSLLWADSKAGPEGYEIGPYKSALRLHGGEIIKLYLELLPRNIPIMLNEILGSTKIIWAVSGDWLADNSLQMLFISVGIFCVARRRKLLYLLPFAPVFINMLSIAISATTNELRYLLPTDAVFLLLVAYSAVAYREMNKRQVLI